MPSFLMKLFEMFISKKKIIGWISAIIMAAGAMIIGMNSQEFKDAVCSAQLPQAEAPAAPAAPPKSGP